MEWTRFDFVWNQSLVLVDSNIVTRMNSNKTNKKLKTSQVLKRRFNGAEGNMAVSFLLVEVFRREIPDLPDRFRERISISPPKITVLDR